MRWGNAGVVGALLLSLVFLGTSASPAAAACASSIGPGIAPPTAIPAGVPGFHAAWYGQSGYMTLCPADSAVATVAFYNTGSAGWVSGRLGEAAHLGTSGPEPGQDRPSGLGGDGTNGSPATGWPRFNRVAVQPVPYVGPGQVAWFQFRVRAPVTPGRYSLGLRPLIEGAQWMEDVGVFWNVVVLNPDGTQPPVVVGGLSFNPANSARADVYSETTITKIDASSIVAVVDGDIARIEADIGRTFTGRPTLFIFASPSSAVFGFQTIARRTALEAAQFAKLSGLYDSETGNAYLVWSNVSRWPMNTARHELTHMLLHQIAGPRTPLPAWFNEGNAVLEELTVPGSSWEASIDHHTAASAAASSPSALVPLGDLVSQATWNSRIRPLALFQYYEASEAARLLREDTGPGGTALLLDLMRRGFTFDAAVLAVTGRSTELFASRFPARVRSTVAAYPGVVLATDTIAGPGVTFVAYGFAPARSLNVTISAAGYRTVTTTGVTDAFGAYWSYVTAAAGWPLGNYSITASDGVMIVSTTVVLSAAWAGATSAAFRQSPDSARDRDLL